MGLEWAASLSLLLLCPPDATPTAEAAAAGGLYAQGEECGCAGASVDGGGGEGLAWQCLGLVL